MNSENSVNYAVYELYPKQYVKPPDGFRCCPVCGGALSKSTILPSKAVTSYLAYATMPYHIFSHLYECPTCHWWAVWERFGDAEYSPDFQFLIASRSNDDHVPLDKPWNPALENENAYDHDMLLPESLEQVLIDGKKRITDLPKPGDKVRLVGDVHMLQDLELVPLYIGGSEGTVVTDEELYAITKDKIKEEMTEWLKEMIKDDREGYIKNEFERLKFIMEAKNCCPIRLEKLVVSDGRWHPNSCKKGEVYLISAADIQKMD